MLIFFCVRKLLINLSIDRVISSVISLKCGPVYTCATKTHSNWNAGATALGLASLLPRLDAEEIRRRRTDLFDEIAGAAFFRLPLPFL